MHPFMSNGVVNITTPHRTLTQYELLLISRSMSNRFTQAPILSNPKHQPFAFTTTAPVSPRSHHCLPLSPRRPPPPCHYVRHQPTLRHASLPENQIPDTSSKTRQSSNTYFATCARGLGQYLAAELASPVINAQILSVHASGVRFSSLKPGHLTAYRACLWLRTATRVLYQLYTQPVCNHGYALGREIYEICKRSAHWENLLAGGRSFAVRARVSPRTGISERGVATCVKDAICDTLTRRREPPNSYDQADVCVFVAVDDVIEVYLDMGGGSLHKRGYRTGVIHKAGLNECVAAGMAYMAGFTPDGKFENAKMPAEEVVLADPMCGSGTLLIEAGLLWSRVAVGLFRREFGCERWVDCDERAINEVRHEAVQCQRKDTEEWGLRLLGGDKHKGALGLAGEAIQTTGLRHMTELWRGDVKDMQAGAVDVTVCNPPWGMRMDADGAWEGLGQFLRRGGEGIACVMSGAKQSGSRALRMRAKRKIPVRVGGVDARVLVYDVLPRR